MPRALVPRTPTLLAVAVVMVVSREGAEGRAPNPLLVSTLRAVLWRCRLGLPKELLLEKRVTDLGKVSARPVPPLLAHPVEMFPRERARRGGLDRRRVVNPSKAKTSLAARRKVRIKVRAILMLAKVGVVLPKASPLLPRRPLRRRPPHLPPLLRPRPRASTVRRHRRPSMRTVIRGACDDCWHCCLWLVLVSVPSLQFNCFPFSTFRALLWRLR